MQIYFSLVSILLIFGQRVIKIAKYNNSEASPFYHFLIAEKEKKVAGGYLGIAGICEVISPY